MLKSLSLVLLLILGTAARADVYKWTDENGRVHYGDRPSVEHEADPIQVDAAPGEKKPESPQPAAPAPAKGEGQVAPAAAAADTPQADAGESDECTTLKAKFEKYKKGLIDFSYESATGRKIVPAKAKVIEAYEEAIAKACV